MVDTLVTMDPRGRVGLGQVTKTREAQYVAEELPGGRILLTPAVVLTTDELAILSDSETVEAIKRARNSDPTTWRRREPPAPSSS